MTNFIRENLPIFAAHTRAGKKIDRPWLEKFANLANISGSMGKHYYARKTHKGKAPVGRWANFRVGEADAIVKDQPEKNIPTLFADLIVEDPDTAKEIKAGQWPRRSCVLDPTGSRIVACDILGHEEDSWFGFRDTHRDYQYDPDSPPVSVNGQSLLCYAYGGDDMDPENMGGVPEAPTEDDMHEKSEVHMLAMIFGELKTLNARLDGLSAEPEPAPAPEPEAVPGAEPAAPPMEGGEPEAAAPMEDAMPETPTDEPPAAEPDEEKKEDEEYALQAEEENRTYQLAVTRDLSRVLDSGRVVDGKKFQERYRRIYSLDGAEAASRMVDAIIAATPPAPGAAPDESALAKQDADRVRKYSLDQQQAMESVIARGVPADEVRRRAVEFHQYQYASGDKDMKLEDWLLHMPSNNRA